MSEFALDFTVFSEASHDSRLLVAENPGARRISPEASLSYTEYLHFGAKEDSFACV